MKKKIEVDSFLQFQFVSNPSFSPDGKKAAFVVQKANLFISRAVAVYGGFQEYQSNINTQINDDIDRINELGETIF